MSVRMRSNPSHYQIEGDTAGTDSGERLSYICSRNVELLENHDLVSTEPGLTLTEFGSAMARYYINFETMKIILGLPRQAKISEIVS